MLNHIELYNNNGWATFPCNKTSKRPVVSGWKDLLPNLLELDEEGYTRAGAYGVLLNADDLVIDIDPRNFKLGDKPWKRLCADLNLPELSKRSPKVKTGSGGIHIYFKKPADANIVAKLDAYPGIDFKGGYANKGTYVIGPGSGHESGEVYEFMGDANLCEIPNAPDELLSLLTKPAMSLMVVNGTNKLDGGVQEFNRYVKWLKKFPPAVEGQNGDAQTFKAAVKGRDYGLTAEDTFKALADHYNPLCAPQWTDDELRVKVNNAYRYATLPAGREDPALAFEPVATGENWDEETDELRKWDIDGNEKTKKTLRNAVNYLYLWPELKDTVKYNMFTGDYEVVGKLPWHDKRNGAKIWEEADVILLKYYIAKKTRIEYPTPLLWEAIQAAGKRYSYHPVRDYITGLKWDGVARINLWLSMFCRVENNAYTEAVGRKMLVGMVARAFEPGVKYDYCTVFEGAQGIGKSTACAILGGGWYGDIILDPHHKDTIDALRGKWIIELSEMEVTRRSDAQALKAFISRTTDRARLAYERSSKDFPRQCVFVGTINPDGLGYLTDHTGNRRFWPIKCHGHFDLDGLKKHRDQLFAEAYEVYKKGEELYLSGDVAKLAEIEQGARTHVDPWADVVSDWLEAEGKEIMELTTQQVYELILGGQIKSITRQEQIRIGHIFVTLGWTKHRPSRGGSRQYVYTRAKKQNNETL